MPYSVKCVECQVWPSLINGIHSVKRLVWAGKLKQLLTCVWGSVKLVEMCTAYRVIDWCGFCLTMKGTLIYTAAPILHLLASRCFRWTHEASVLNISAATIYIFVKCFTIHKYSWLPCATCTSVEFYIALKVEQLSNRTRGCNSQLSLAWKSKYVIL